MLTNDFLGDNIARLGFGAMRLPIIDGDASNVDQATLDAMVDTAIKAGVNYFDTLSLSWWHVRDRAWPFACALSAR